MNFESTKTVRDLIYEAAELYENVAYIRTLRDNQIHDTSFMDFKKESDSVASWTEEQSKKLGHPARVAFLSTNSPLYIRMMLGVMSGGGVAILLDPQANEDVICACINKSEADILAWETKLSPDLENIKNRCKCTSDTIEMTENLSNGTCGNILDIYAGKHPADGTVTREDLISLLSSANDPAIVPLKVIINGEEVK